MTSSTVTYVYGVVGESAAPPAHPGIGGQPLELVRGSDVAALVSDAPDGELSFDREAMMIHARVLEEAHAQGTVLPMRFGVVMGDRQDVLGRLLERHHQHLRAQLQAFDGKAELKLRATYDEERLLSDVVAEDRDVARLRRSLRGLPQDATYYGRIELGQLVSRAIDRMRERDARALLEELAPLSLDQEIAAPRHERIVLDASFLVTRSQLDAFDARVEQLAERAAGKIRFKFTGPLPPHSFVNLGAED